MIIFIKIDFFFFALEGLFCFVVPEFKFENVQLINLH